MPQLEGNTLRWHAGVILLLALVRIPVLTGPANLSWDGAEYIDIARNIADGEGPTLKIRAYFFGDGYRTPYPAATLRSTLFPLLMAQVYAAIPSPRVFQWFNFGVFLVNISLLALIFRKAFPVRIALYSLCLVGLTEPMFLTSVFPWAEQTAFFWLLLTLFLVNSEVHVRFGAWGAAVEGLAAGLASLSRPEYCLVGVLFFTWHLTRRRRNWMAWSSFLLGFLFWPTFSALTNYRTFGRTFLPGTYLFHSRGYESYFAWDGPPRLGFADFIAGNAFWVAGRIALNFVNYTAKLVGWKNLLLLSAAIPWVLLRSVNGSYDGLKRLMAGIATAFFVAYCLVWGGIDRERYLLPVTTFLLPLCLLEVDRWRRSGNRTWLRRGALLAMILNLPLTLGNTIAAGLKVQARTVPGERFYARHNPAWANPDMEKLAAWVRKELPSDAVLCLENPFLLNYLTGRSAVMLPEQIAPSRFLTFLEGQGVGWWVTNTTYTKGSAEQLGALEGTMREAGAREIAHLGSYRVWQVPPRGPH